MVGSEDPLQHFLKGIFVQEGSSGTRFDHGQFKLKPLLFMPPYSVVVGGGEQCGFRILLRDSKQ